MSVAIGIDLGTTNTVAAAVINGVAVTLEDEQGRRLLPSVVSFHPSGTVLVGEPARERGLVDPDNTIFSFKPLLGRVWGSEEIDSAKARFPFELVEGVKNSTMVLARGVAYALPEISAFVLRRVKAIAEATLGQSVERAVITVPASFDDLQRASTKIAGKLAGIDVMRILNEPTAAALAYGQSISRAEKIAVYDLGGGTFDVTLLDLTGHVFEVLATAGDTSLGGHDIDRALADAMAREVLRNLRHDPRMDPKAMARLALVAEQVKVELSAAESATRELSGIGYGDRGRPLAMPWSMTRDELEALAEPLVARTIEVARRSIEAAGLSPRDFHRVVLVGGATRMPLVARMVEELFGAPPHQTVNSEEVVALGAALQAHALNRHKRGPKRLSAHDRLAQAAPQATGGRMTTRPPDADPALSPADVPKAPPVPKMAPEPPSPTTRRSLSFDKAPATISFADVSSGVVGAPRAPRSERGGAIAASAAAPVLIDVTPLGVGVETAGGFTDVLIPANTPVPCEKTRTFLTARDGQTSVSIRVARGGAPRFADNTPLGELELTGLRSAPRGEVKVVVTFGLDADGILDVRAREHGTGREMTVKMRVLGANTDAEDVATMAARQASHDVA